MEGMKMSSSSWKELLRQNLAKSQNASESLPRVAVMGVGSELRGDDAAGVTVARLLKQEPLPERVLVIDAGSAPENFTGPLRRFEPNWVLWVDAAQVGGMPGSVYWLDWRETEGVSASTHTLPPYVLGGFITAELKCKMIVIGIEPEQNSFDAPLSTPVAAAVEEVARFLAAELQ